MQGRIQTEDLRTVNEPGPSEAKLKVLPGKGKFKRGEFRGRQDRLFVEENCAAAALFGILARQAVTTGSRLRRTESGN